MNDVKKIEIPLTLDGQTVGLETGPGGLAPGRETLVLIHGSGGSRLSWRGQLKPLDRVLNVAALELPGHGETPGPAQGTIGERAAWLLRALDELPLPGRPYLAGTSMGGAVVLETALLRPGFAAGLILIGTGAVFDGGRELAEDFERDYRQALSDFSDRLFSPAANPALIRQSRELLAEVDPETLVADLKASAAFDRMSDLPDLVLPSLVICGRDDRITPPEMARKLAGAMPLAQLEMIDDAGHMVMAEQFRAVNEAILKFVGRNQ